MADKKISNYLLYAIGEIALVMIGILLALQVSNWNDEAKDKAELAKTLQTFVANFEADISDMDSNIFIIKTNLQYWDSLLTHSDNEKLANDVILNIESSYIPVNNAGYKVSLSNNTFNILENEALKTRLISYYETDFFDDQRMITYHYELLAEFTLMTIEQAMKYRAQKSFGAKMTMLLKDEAFVELVRSHYRTYEHIMERLKKRTNIANRLIKMVKVELKTMI